MAAGFVVIFRAHIKVQKHFQPFGCMNLQESPPDSSHPGAGNALGLLSSYSSDTPQSQDADRTPERDSVQPASPSHPAQPASAGQSGEASGISMAEAAANNPEESAQLSAETAAVMQKLLAFVKVGFSAQWLRLLVHMP